MNDRPIPKLDPAALREERHNVDLGTEAESEGHDHVQREPGRAPADDAAQPTGGASPPAR